MEVSVRPSTGTVLTAVLILPLLTVLPATVRAQAPDWPGPRNRPAAVRLEVTPRATRVYVDATYAGVVDDFDGLFQRLHVVPGRHEIVLYLDGYRTIRQTMDLRAGADYKVRQTMQKLGAGEKSEPPPVAPPEGGEKRGREEMSGYPLPPPPPYGPGARGRRPRPEDQPAAQAAGFGTLSIRVQPEGAEVLIDGNRWQSPEGRDALVVHLAAGTHHVEVRKEGFVPFATDVPIREGDSSPLNVSLPERR
jgi:hypothetical protein